MAFQFLDQPYSLDLGIESSPPLYRSETRTRLSLDADVAKNQTTIDVQRVRGRLYEIDVAVPPGLELISVGPPDLVESSTLLAKEAAGRGDTGHAGLIRPGRPRQPHEPGPGSEVLFAQPASGTSGSGLARRSTWAFLGPGLRLDSKRLSGLHGARPHLRGRETEWPAARIPRSSAVNRSASATLANAARSGQLPVLVLQSNHSPASLRGRLIRHPLAIAKETRISARVSRRRVDVRQETSLQVRYGTVSSLIVQVPFPETDAWDVQAKETIRREDLGSVPGEAGQRRYRLTFRSTDLGSIVAPVPLSSPPGTDFGSGWRAEHDDPMDPPSRREPSDQLRSNCRPSPASRRR